jgi:hypothetical protein
MDGSKPALLKKGLLRGESLSGHPEGAKAPEGSPTILMGRRPERSEGWRAAGHASLSLGRTDGGRKGLRLLFILSIGHLL